jgi:hypothetical protein
MEIGKPRRVYRVEPLREPVPSKEREPEAPPVAPVREEPTTAPAK